VPRLLTYTVLKVVDLYLGATLSVSLTLVCTHITCNVIIVQSELFPRVFCGLKETTHIHKKIYSMYVKRPFFAKWWTNYRLYTRELCVDAAGVLVYLII